MIIDCLHLGIRSEVSDNNTPIYGLLLSDAFVNLLQSVSVPYGTIRIIISLKVLAKQGMDIKFGLSPWASIVEQEMSQGGRALFSER